MLHPLLYNTCLLLLNVFSSYQLDTEIKCLFKSVKVLTCLVQPGLTRKVIDLSTQKPYILWKATKLDNTFHVFCSVVRDW